MQAPRVSGGFGPTHFHVSSRWGEWSASRPERALLTREDPGTHCTGGWVGFRAGLDREVRGKILCPAGDRTPVVQSVVTQSSH
jgi:hypothetical protein